MYLTQASVFILDDVAHLRVRLHKSFWTEKWAVYSVTFDSCRSDLLWLHSIFKSKAIL